MPDLSPTMFSTGPDDTLATVDVYDESGEKTINFLKDISEEIDTEGLSALKGGNLLDEFNMDSMMASLGNSFAELKVSSEALLKGILASNGGLMSALRSLPSGMQFDLLNPNIVSSILATFNGITGLLKGVDLRTLQGLAQLISGLTCSNVPYGFTDYGGLIGLGSGAIRRSSQLGMRGSYGAFKNCNKIPPQVLMGIALRLSYSLLEDYDNDLLLDIADSIGGPYIYQQRPDFIYQYINGYTNKKGTGNLDYYNEYRKMQQAFTLMNPNWQMTPYGNGNGVNGNYAANASPDFLRTLEAGVDGQLYLIDASDPSNIDTATGTSSEAYMLLVRNAGKSIVRPTLKQEFPYSRVKVYEA